MVSLSVSFQNVITIIGFLLNDNNKQEIAQKTQTNVTTHTFLVYHSKASVLLSTENGIWRQTTSFCCASVISCGISGTDVPP